MKFESKKSPTRHFIFAALSFSLILFAFAGCKKDRFAPPELEKKILDFSIPFKNVVINEEKHHIIIYETEDLDQITPTIEVSDGVTIEPASGVTIHENQPVTYTLTAADGSTATYALIVCRVEWEYYNVMGFGQLSITRMGHFKEPWTAVSKNGILTIHFGKETESAIELYINSPISFALVGQFPMGSYTPPNVPEGESGGIFAFRENGVVKIFDKPVTGQIKIEGYDAGKGTISGRFSQIKYWANSTQTEGYPYFSLDGSFENLPIEIK